MLCRGHANSQRKIANRALALVEALCPQERRDGMAAKDLLSIVNKAMSAVRTVVGKEAIEEKGFVFRGAMKALGDLRGKLQHTINSRHNTLSKEQLGLLDRACDMLALPTPTPISADTSISADEDLEEQEERDDDDDDLAPDQERPGPDTPEVVHEAWDLIMGQDELRKSIRFQLLPLLCRVHDNVQSGKDAASATEDRWYARANDAR